MRRIASVSAVLLCVCAYGWGAREPASASAQPAPAPPAVAVLPKSFLCPSGPFEKGNPQSRFRKGGCLESFQYVFAENGATPPDMLPSVVYGFHFAIPKALNKFVKVELHRAAEDTCVKATEGGEAIVDALPLYNVFATSWEGERLNLCAGEAYEHLRQEELRCSPAELQHLDGKAFAIPGYWEWDSTKGEYREKAGDKQVFTLACATGVAAKCMHWGYPPWAEHNGTALKEHFLACVQAARAQYRSDKDKAYTCKGAVIDIFDNLGIQVPDKSLPALSFEGSWGKDGLVSLSRARYGACRSKPELQALLDAAPSSNGALISVWSGANVTPGGQCPDEPEFCLPVNVP